MIFKTIKDIAEDGVKKIELKKLSIKTSYKEYVIYLKRATKYNFRCSLTYYLLLIIFYF